MYSDFYLIICVGKKVQKFLFLTQKRGILKVTLLIDLLLFVPRTLIYSLLCGLKAWMVWHKIYFRPYMPSHHTVTIVLFIFLFILCYNKYCVVGGHG